MPETEIIDFLLCFLLRLTVRYPHMNVQINDFIYTLIHELMKSRRRGHTLIHLCQPKDTMFSPTPLHVDLGYRKTYCHDRVYFSINPPTSVRA